MTIKEMVNKSVKVSGIFSAPVPVAGQFGHGMDQEAMRMLKQHGIGPEQLYRYDDPNSQFKDLYTAIQEAKKGNNEPLRKAIQERFGNASTGFGKESQTAQFQMGMYWDRIRTKQDEGLTPGQAVMAVLAEMRREGEKIVVQAQADEGMRNRMESFFSPTVTLKRHKIGGKTITGFWYPDMVKDIPYVRQLIDEAGIDSGAGSRVADNDLDACELAAGRHGFSVETIGDDEVIVAQAQAKPGYERVNGKRIACYDDGKSVDRYTVVYLDEPAGEPGLYAAVGMNASPFHPQGFGQHTTAMLGRHLGRRIPFGQLPEDCRKLVMGDLGRPEAQAEQPAPAEQQGKPPVTAKSTLGSPIAPVIGEPPENRESLIAGMEKGVQDIMSDIYSFAFHLDSESKNILEELKRGMGHTGHRPLYLVLWRIAQLRDILGEKGPELSADLNTLWLSMNEKMDRIGNRPSLSE